MKTTTKKMILILILALPVLFLSGCEDADWDLLEMAFEAWAEEEGLYENGKYQPDAVIENAVQDTIGDITNAEENVQWDAIKVVRDIEKADELASKAMMGSNPMMMAEAIELRPNDWRLQEKNATYTLANAGSWEVGLFYESDDLLKEQIQQGGEGVDCVALRIQQLEYREILLSDALTNCWQGRVCNDFSLTTELELVQERLYHLYNGNATSFCD